MKIYTKSACVSTFSKRQMPQVPEVVKGAATTSSPSAAVESAGIPEPVYDRLKLKDGSRSTSRSSCHPRTLRFYDRSK